MLHEREFQCASLHVGRLGAHKDFGFDSDAAAGAAAPVDGFVLDFGLKRALMIATSQMQLNTCNITQDTAYHA